MRRLLLCVLIATACLRPPHVPPPLPDEHRGLYEIGFEANHFQPCRAARSDRYPVQFLPGARPTEWPDGAPGSFNSTLYYVRWRGTLAPIQRVPLGTAPLARPITVTEVLEIRAPRRGECGWRR